MSEKQRTCLKHVSDAELTAAVASATAYLQIVNKLGLSPGGGTVRSLRRRIGKLNLDVSHFKGYARTRLAPIKFTPRRSATGSVHINDLTDEQFTEILTRVSTYQAFGKAVGKKHTAGSFASGVRKRAERLGLSMDHFVFTKLDSGGVKRKRSSMFVQDSPAKGYPAPRLREMIIEEGLLPNKCNTCGGPPEWQGKPLGLNLFCKNGDRGDLRIENIQLLCPNCFSQSNSDFMSERGKHGAEVKKKNFKMKRYREILSE